MRSSAQQYWDRFVLLFLFGAVPPSTPVGGNLKAQKLAFLLELAGLRAGAAIGHYRFFRYQMGPYSRDVAADIAQLTAGQFLHGNRQPTKRGEFLRDYILEFIGEDEDFRLTNELVAETVAEHGRKSGAALKDLVYGLRVPVFDFGGNEMKVRDIPSFVDILDPVHTGGIRDVALPDELVEDIKAEFAIAPERLDRNHPSYKQTIRRTLERISA